MGIAHKRKEENMKVATEIFEKATVRGFADYLLFGLKPEQDERDYKARLDDKYDEFEELALKYDSQRSSDLLSSANAMALEYGCVYLEIGLQAGLLFVADMMRNIQREKENAKNDVDYCAMSQSMIDDMKKALDLITNESLENDNIEKACDILKRWKN